MKNNGKKLILALAIPLATGGLAALLSGGMGRYSQVVQPPLSPPGWLFPIAWSVLYLLMGYSSYRVWVAPADGTLRQKAIRLYALQLAVNFLWPIVFFAFGWYWAAFAVLLILWVLILLTIRAFGAVEDTAADLLLPYLLWVTFAGYLNLGVALLN